MLAPRFIRDHTQSHSRRKYIYDLFEFNFRSDFSVKHTDDGTLRFREKNFCMKRWHVTVITEPLLKFLHVELLLLKRKLRISDTTLRYAPFWGHWPPLRVCLASLSVFPGTQTSSNHRISIKRILQMQMRKIFFTEHSEGKFHEVSRYQALSCSFLLSVHLSPDICYCYYGSGFLYWIERKISYISVSWCSVNESLSTDH